eukprot:850717_1
MAIILATLPMCAPAIILNECIDETNDTSIKSETTRSYPYHNYSITLASNSKTSNNECILTIDTCNYFSNYDTKLFVYDIYGNEIASNDGDVMDCSFHGDDGILLGLSFLTLGITSETQTKYHVMVTGSTITDVGMYELRLLWDEGCVVSWCDAKINSVNQSNDKEHLHQQMQ